MDNNSVGLNVSDELTSEHDTLLKKIKRNSFLLGAFFIPASILLVVYLIRGIYPLGKSSVLVLDLNAQYVYFFEQLRDIFQGNASVLYTWQRAMGGEFLGMFAYYVASPFNFIIALFPEGMITESLLFIFLLKAGLSGFNFAVYLKKTQRCKSKLAILTFSSLYALTAYAVVNSHNTMWIDAVLFLPLIIMGLESLINNKKYILYTTLLAITVFANFYIGYMVCIFIILYFFYYYFVYGCSDRYNKTGESLHFIKSALRVLFFSILALAIAAVILLSVYTSLKFGKNDFSDPKLALEAKFDLLDIAAKMLPNSYDTVRPEGLPFVYCGLLTLILLPLYFLNGKISIREKIGGAVLLALLAFSFNGSTFDIIWHGMQVPNWLNYRYSFIFCFMAITFACQIYGHIKELSFSFVAAICASLGVLILVLQKQNYSFLDDIVCIWFSLIFVGVYLVTLYCVKKNYQYGVGSLVLAIIVCTELLINCYVTMDDLDEDVIYSSRPSYTDFIENVQPLVDFVHERDSSFYRMEKTFHRKTNDNMTLDINGLTNSTSTLNASIIELLNRLGYASKSHWSKYLGGSPVSDSLLGLKYIITDNEDSDSLYDKIYDDGEYYIYENPYALSLAFAVNKEIQNMDWSLYDSPFELLNNLATCLLGSEERIELFKTVEGVTEDMVNVTMTYVTEDYFKYAPKNTENDAKLKYSFKAPNEEELFLFFPSAYPREVSLKLNNRNWGTFFGNETDRIVSLGHFASEQPVELSATLESDCLYLLMNRQYFYYLDSQLFDEVMTRLAENQFEIEEYKDTYFKGKINTTSDSSLIFTTIPYDEGWKITLDGKRVMPVKTADSLIAIEAAEGSHTLELKYMPDSFAIGSVISVTAVVLFIAIIVFDKSIAAKRKKKAVLQQEQACGDASDNAEAAEKNE